MTPEVSLSETAEQALAEWHESRVVGNSAGGGTRGDGGCSMVATRVS